MGILIVQACEMAAFIYQSYCISGKSIEELSKEYHVDEKYSTINGTVLWQQNKIIVQMSIFKSGNSIIEGLPLFLFTITNYKNENKVFASGKMWEY